MREIEIRSKSPATCLRCEGQRWVCEEHDDQPWGGPHGCLCGGAGAPCPACNDPDAPDNPPGFVVICPASSTP